MGPAKLTLCVCDSLLTKQRYGQSLDRLQLRALSDRGLGRLADTSRRSILLCVRPEQPKSRRC